MSRHNRKTVTPATVTYGGKTERATAGPVKIVGVNATCHADGCDWAFRSQHHNAVGHARQHAKKEHPE